MVESSGSRLLPKTKMGKISGVLGIIASLYALFMVFEAGNLPQTIAEFTARSFSVLGYVVFIAIIPVWLLALSGFFLSFGKTENKVLGWSAGLVAFIAGLLGILATFTSYAALTQAEEMWNTFLLLWDIEYLLLGVALLLGGLLFLKIGISTTEKKGLILIAAVVYLAIGIFGLFAGLSTATSMITLFDRSIYPIVAGAVIAPSIFTIPF